MTIKAPYSAITRALAIFQSIGHKYGEAGSLSSIGSIYVALGDLRSALDYHHQSLAIERSIGNKHGEAESLLLLGELYVQSSGSPLAFEPLEMLPQQALGYLDQALALAQELEAKELIYRANLVLSQAHQQQGDFALALAHHQAFYAVQREIFDEALIEKTKRLQVIHQVETSKREAALQRAEAEVFRLKTVELAGALADADYHRQIAEQASLLKSEMPRSPRMI